MTHLKTMARSSHSDERVPIETFFGDTTLDFGVATIPKLFLRFYPHLVSNGEQLNDRQAMILVQVMTLGQERDFELRAENLPVISGLAQIEKDKAAFRRMGLVFTARLYYPATGNRPPVLRAQRWDFRTLFHNLTLIGQEWLSRYQELVAEWERQGRKGRRPVYVFPSDFQHEIGLPPGVANDILNGQFYPMPARWHEVARQMEPTALNSSGRQMPTAPNSRGRSVPTALNSSGRSTPTTPNSRGHLLVVDVVDVDQEKGIGHSFSDDAVFAHFADRKGQTYSPTGRDRQALSSLRIVGYSFQEIIAGIDQAFDRGDQPKRFAYCARIVQDTPPAHSPAAPVRSPHVLEPSAESDRLSNLSSPPASVDVPVDLAKAVEVYRGSGQELRPDVIARLRLLAEECDAAARQHGSTGAEWLTQALQRSLGVADDLLLYAQGVLRNWIAHGPNLDVRPGRAGYRPARYVDPPVETPPQTRPIRDWDAE